MMNDIIYALQTPIVGLSMMSMSMSMTGIFTAVCTTGRSCLVSLPKMNFTGALDTCR
jgi:hypothetical protein